MVLELSYCQLVSIEIGAYIASPVNGASYVVGPQQHYTAYLI